MMIELLSFAQYEKLRKGEIMQPIIAKAPRAKCLGCGGVQFSKKKFNDFENPMPFCTSCFKWPDSFRVLFSIPVIGENSFKKLSREIDQRGRKLDSPSKADAFCDFVKEKLKLEGNDFDPRELGTKEEQEVFKLGVNCNSYLKYQVRRVKEGILTPGGFRNIEKAFRLYIVPMFERYSIKDMNFQLINNSLRKEFFDRKTSNGSIEQVAITKNIKIEVIKYLGPYFDWCIEEGLIKAPPKLPIKPSYNKADPKRLYTVKQRDMVIENLISANCKLKNPESLEKQKQKYRRIQIALKIMAGYTKRTGEVEALTWGKINFRTQEISFNTHLSENDAYLRYIGKKEKGTSSRVDIAGLKSSPDAELVYDWFPGLQNLLMELGPSFNPKTLLFDNGKGQPLAKDAIWKAWNKSATDLVEKGLLPHYVDVHRGIRTSTITHLKKKGFGLDSVSELHGGDKKTVENFYIRKDKQIIGEDVFRETSSFLQ